MRSPPRGLAQAGATLYALSARASCGGALGAKRRHPAERGVPPALGGVIPNSKGAYMKLRLLGLVSILTAMFEAAGAGFKG